MSGRHHLLELDNITKYYGNILALRDVTHVRQRRRGHVRARRQRRRQVDADQDPLGRCTSRPRARST